MTCACQYSQQTDIAQNSASEIELTAEQHQNCIQTIHLVWTAVRCKITLVKSAIKVQGNVSVASIAATTTQLVLNSTTSRLAAGLQAPQLLVHGHEH